MKVLAIIKYLFGLVGLGMLAGSFFLYQNTQEFLNTAITTEGTVIEVVRTRSSDSVSYRPVVAFRNNSGEAFEFTSSTGSNPPRYSRGDKLEILYQADRPEKARINSFFSLWGAAVIVGGLGAVFFLIGFCIFLLGFLAGNKKERLKLHGRRVQAKFQRVELNGSLKVNGRSPFQIIAQWQDPMSNDLYIYKSENLWFDPSDHIKDEYITVFIDKDKPKKHYMDISFLPKVAN